ncbi:hypothetical protein [Nocardioides daejeonensis]|uniref:hypothetical protein n=1 Tax=Nocardioides daejeonensis TaxID=1046556 RepID=UPI000D741F8F|nr:hypothetical protein [Nocardioides daejeonensis]
MSSDESVVKEALANRRPMTPLQRVAMGLVLVALDTLGRVDTLPDPIGWTLVIWGVAALPLPERRALVASAALALVTSAVLWVPQAKDWVADTELALKWATSLPDLLFVVLLSRALIAAARGQKPVDRKVAGRFGLSLTLAVIVTAMVPVGYAADSDQIVGYAELGFVLLWLYLVWNLFAVHSRTWLGGTPTTG